MSEKKRLATLAEIHAAHETGPAPEGEAMCPEHPGMECVGGCEMVCYLVDCTREEAFKAAAELREARKSTAPQGEPSGQEGERNNVIRLLRIMGADCEDPGILDRIQRALVWLGNPTPVSPRGDEALDEDVDATDAILERGLLSIGVCNEDGEVAVWTVGNPEPLGVGDNIGDALVNAGLFRTRLAPSGDEVEALAKELDSCGWAIVVDKGLHYRVPEDLHARILAALRSRLTREGEPDGWILEVSADNDGWRYSNFFRKESDAEKARERFPYVNVRTRVAPVSRLSTTTQEADDGE